MKRLIPGVIAASAAFIADFTTKAWVLGMADSLPLEILPFFNLRLAFNRGISFSLLSADSDTGVMLLIALATAITVLLVYMLWRASLVLERIALGLALGGAIGNILDRVRYGAVVDFLDFHYQGYSFPTFNVADTAISIGVGLLLIASFRSHQEKS
ncbi:MAG: signal peptidase II [Holosporales bacterium]